VPAARAHPGGRRVAVNVNTSEDLAAAEALLG
jgi:GTP:adenosylcobinamide-phosphate guanylyltransferase